MTTYTAPGGKILVVLDPQQTISPGGIILPDNAQERSGRTLEALRSGTRPLVVGGVEEFGPFNFVGPSSIPGQ